jgi:hypothetical protein
VVVPLSRRSSSSRIFLTTSAPGSSPCDAGGQDRRSPVIQPCHRPSLPRKIDASPRAPACTRPAHPVVLIAYDIKRGE